MCDRRTSSRARKQVDYSALGENNFEGDNDDEDFATSSRGPAVKKLRTAKEKVTEKLKSINPKQTSSSKSNDKTSKERLFERDLELVMSLSKTSSDPKASHIEPVSVSSQISSAPNSVDAKVLQYTGSSADKETRNMQLESSFTEEIQSEKKEEVASIKKTNSDLSSDDADLSDHPSSSDAESSEEDDDGSDGSSSSDTCRGRLTKTKGLSKRNTKATPAKPTKSAKQTLEKSKNSKIVKPVNPASSSQKTMARSNIPKDSGGHANAIYDKQSSYSSPTSGVLRIGLSRNVKVKPLHQLNSPTSNSIKS